MISKSRRVSGNTLIILGSILLLGSAAAKLAHIPPVVVQMSADGIFGGRLTFVAVLEVLSAVLFLIPVTRSAGLLMVSSFLGGAIATHLQHGQPFVPPSILLAVLWLGTLLRHPQILWSFSNSIFGAGETSEAHRRDLVSQEARKW